MSDIAAWLENLGLGKYQEVFAENEIGFNVLPKLTEKHLKELGLPMGPRLTLLDAIATLASEKSGTNRSSEAGASVEPPASTQAERRQLTVMFVDLVGSTALSGLLDPEDMRGLILAYQNAVAGEITRFEGYLAKYMGDGVLAYFGWPQAHEDEAERAVRAALAVTGVVGKLRTPADELLAARVGIATGLVVVGDLIGEGAAQEEAVVGETPNLAARLQALAEPGSVVIAQSTRQLLGTMFELEALEPQSLKGIAESVKAWRVIAPVAAESRFDVTRRAGLTPLVGREHEIGLLLDRWRQAKEGDGQTVLLSGEAGIGKSRITDALQERTAGDEPVRFRYQCSPYYTNSALHPVIEQLERAAHFDGEDTNEHKLEKLESLLEDGATALDLLVPLFAALLSIPTGHRYPPVEMAPEQQKEATLGALVMQMESMSRNHPVLIIFEDVHWADPSSLELLELVIERIRDSTVLVIITFRPEFDPPWQGFSHVTSLTLNRFSRSLANQMVEEIAGGKPLPETMLEQIIEKTDGVPLFVEELTKTILESGVLIEEPAQYSLSGPLREVTVPATLYDSLMARLDRLGAVKEVAQVASIIGREFGYDLLAAVSPLSFGELHDAVAQLIDAELVFRRGDPKKGDYIFKHALVQDAAYGSLLKSKRQELHGQIAKVLQSRFPERAEFEPELLAHHYTEAGLLEPAIEQWKKAGLRALQSSANAEASSHLLKALELFGKLKNSSERAREELSLQTMLAPALTASRGFTAPETGNAFFRARELCHQIGDVAQMLPVLYGVWNYRYVGGQFHDAFELAQECLDLGRKQQERTHLVAAHSMLGQNLLSMGRFDKAQHHLETSITLYEPEQDRALWQVYGEDPGMAALVWRSWGSWFRGFPEQALSQSHEAIKTTQQRSDMVTAGGAPVWAAVIRYLRRERDAAQQAAQDAIDFCTEQNIPVFRIFATVMKGWSLVEGGHLEEGASQMQRGVAEWKSNGTKLFMPLFLTLLAQGHASSGEFSEALELIDEASQLIRSGGEGMWESELHRLRGAYWLATAEDQAVVESAFSRAIEIARGQRSHSMELRAATSLARLWQNQGKRRQAHELLVPLYNWFTEGFDTADLKEAKALLDELS